MSVISKEIACLNFAGRLLCRGFQRPLRIDDVVDKRRDLPGQGKFDNNPAVVLQKVDLVYSVALAKPAR